MNLGIVYKHGEIEPGIADLVSAANGSGFVTFSSCEEHVRGLDEAPQFPCIGFYADEEKARAIHIALVNSRQLLKCSWVLSGTFVMAYGSNEWRLGWTLECCGIVEPVNDHTEFQSRTVEVAREADIPVLIEMFTVGVKFGS